MKDFLATVLPTPTDTVEHCLRIEDFFFHW